MINITVSSLKGNEVLGRDIVTKNGVVLIPAGTKLKEAYIRKLRELDVFSVYIDDDLEEQPIEKQKQETREDCSKKVKSLIEKHFYTNNSELSRLKEVAEQIILEALTQPEVLLTVNNLRHNREDIYLHSINVCAISVLIAKQMKINDEDIKQIAIGALLHDIGYNYVNAKINNYNKEVNYSSINKEKEKKKHVIYGYDMVENEVWLSRIAKNIILNHHERVDGTGYPFKKHGEGIDIGSRIVAVSDEFDNVVNGKIMKSMKVYMAIDKIVCESGKQFDKKVIEAFRKSISAYPIGTVVVTNTHEIGIVVRQNDGCPTRPVIKILKDEYGNDVREYIEKDMLKVLTLFIDDTIE